MNLVLKFAQTNSNLIRYLSLRQYTSKMSKTALVILAPGAEEMEFTISADVLRRCGVKTILLQKSIKIVI